MFRPRPETNSYVHPAQCGVRDGLVQVLRQLVRHGQSENGEMRWTGQGLDQSPRIGIPGTGGVAQGRVGTDENRPNLFTLPYLVDCRHECIAELRLRVIRQDVGKVLGDVNSLAMWNDG